MMGRSKARSPRRKPHKDDFEAVARRLECDPDLKKFDVQLRKIAKAKPAKSRHNP